MKLAFSIFLSLLLSAGLIKVQASTSSLLAEDSLYGGNSVSASYNKTNSTIELKINSAHQTERALVVLTDRRGNIVFQDSAEIDSHGINLEISLTDLQSGIYFLRVKGKTIDFSGRYSKE